MFLPHSESLRSSCGTKSERGFLKDSVGGIAMDIKAQAEKAKKLRELHHGPRILALPNAWDVVSARILEEVGHPAIATSSAAVAFSLGYPDGQRIPRGEMLDAVARITRAVRVPVTADLESGYGKTPEEIADFTRAMVAAGAVGLNFEDVTETMRVHMWNWGYR